MAMFNFKNSSFGGTGRDHHAGFIFGVDLVLVVPLIVVVAACMFTSVDSSLEQVRVTVTNEIVPHSPMNIHCRTKNNTFLDEHPNVRYNESISWDFQVDLFNTTQYSCLIWYKNPNGHIIIGDFSMYEANRDLYFCGGNCSRFVRKEGIFFYLNKYDTTKLMYEWPHL
ncbi:Plant self-incompatibility S1 [Macleaya cordata]|uniref:Plant self-incompatibility S1 n=1 Tax=Macleaya cordata TaxID=56857 RepID=A0A200PZV3_MACCD|nr:Plant self-incompatibility S1 [Macleaya cordata]